MFQIYVSKVSHTKLKSERSKLTFMIMIEHKTVAYCHFVGRTNKVKCMSTIFNVKKKKSRSSSPVCCLLIHHCLVWISHQTRQEQLDNRQSGLLRKSLLLTCPVFRTYASLESGNRHLRCCKK